MFVTYTPEGDESAAGSWEFNPGQVRSSKAEMIEKRYGKPYAMFVLQAQAGEVSARRVLLWHLLNTDHPAFRWEDTPDFAMDELEVQASHSELAKLWDDAKAAGQSEDVLTAIAAQRDAAPGGPGSGGGKARRKNAAASTSSP